MDVCAASFSCTCIIIIHMVIIEDMKQRCVMCAAGESFNHPDYADWVTKPFIIIIAPLIANYISF